MVIDYYDGRDQIFGQYIGVLPDTVSLLGKKLLTVYQGVESKEKIPADEFWARISLQTVIEGQAAIAGTDLTRRYTTDGLVFVQLFVPKKLPENYDLGVKLAVMIKAIFRGKQTNGCIWFRNVRIQDNLPPEDSWWRINVVAEYQYDEIG